MHKDKQYKYDMVGQREERNKTMARSLGIQRLAVSFRRKSSQRCATATAMPPPPRRRNSGRSLRRHPRFYNATVTSAKGREMEPRDKSETNITPPRATCNDDEWIECSRGGPGKSQKISKTRHGLQKQRNSKAIDITVSF